MMYLVKMSKENKKTQLELNQFRIAFKHGFRSVIHKISLILLAKVHSFHNDTIMV